MTRDIGEQTTTDQAGSDPAIPDPANSGPAIPDPATPELSTPGSALAELLAGNERFVTGTRVHPHQDAEYRASLAAAQAPFAVVFGCSDSRLAAEIIFDRGLGDLFVVRTAGHTVGPEVLGSIEYAVTMFGTPLVVVLGHDSCGAVRAAVDFAAADVAGPNSAGLNSTGQPNGLPTGHVRAIVDAVIPSVRFASTRGINDVDAIVDVHIQRTVDQLLSLSAPLASAVSRGDCAVVGMSYQLSGGRARIVTGSPAA